MNCTETSDPFRNSEWDGRGVGLDGIRVLSKTDSADPRDDWRKRVQEEGDRSTRILETLRVVI